MSGETSPLLLNGKSSDTTSPRSIGGGGGGMNTPLQIESPTIDTGSVRHRRSSVIAIAAAEAIRQDRKKSRVQHSYSQQGYDSLLVQPPFRIPSLTSIGSLAADEAAQERLAEERNKTTQKNTIIDDGCSSGPGIVQFIISQIPAVIIAAGLNFMVVSRKCSIPSCWGNIYIQLNAL